MRGISRGRPPGQTTALYTWMRERGVTVDELAARLHITPNWMSRIRTGSARPDDELKVLIATTTKRIEEERGLKKPRGVPVRAWFPEDAW